MKKVTGTCLCGNIHFSATLSDYHVSACHCGMCRKWSGGVFLSLDVKDSLEITQGESLGLYASSEWAKRGFCTRCGSSLFWQSADGKQTCVSYAALELSEEDREQLLLASEIYTDNQPDFTRFKQEGARLTEADFLKSLGMALPASE
ncbi:GFA family protein [Acerihabitans sp. KWT182]|uniref:GFA family protein n=1 Tax=Acerihabitans sp. KWT182 TaxID=3157919 RepID=A0AAU7QED5_9GAMM